MTNFKRRYSLRLVFLGLLLRVGAIGQTIDGSPSGLIKFLTYQSGRTREPAQDDRLDCRIDVQGRRDRAAYKSLLNFGPKALPAIEKYLDSLQKAESEERANDLEYNAQWVLYAYAKIKGAAAFPRLWQMAYDPKLFSLWLSLIDSFALAFDLTSYVSEFYPAAGISHCHPHQPRDGLNQSILAWEKGDRSLLEASLGPRGKAALSSLLRGRTWAGLRTELSSATPRFGFGIGYRFQVPSVWAVPEAAVENFGDVTSEDDPELETRFKTMSGQDCGTYRVRFLRTPLGEERLSTTYLVDNADLGGLLRLISSCADQ